MGEREGVCSDLDCGNALYEETKVRTSIIDIMMMDTDILMTSDRGAGPLLLLVRVGALVRA